MKKTLGNIFIILQAMILISCATEYEIDAEDLKEDPDLRDQVFSTILNDNVLASEFMKRIGQNPDAMHTMLMNHQLMEQAFSQDNMRMMQEMNPRTMEMMMDNLLQMAQRDSTMQKRIMDHPHIQQMMEGTSGNPPE